MALEFNCPHCDRLLAIDEKSQKLKVECPSCGQPLVPARVIAEKAEAERQKKKQEARRAREEKEHLRKRAELEEELKRRKEEREAKESEILPEDKGRIYEGEKAKAETQQKVQGMRICGNCGAQLEDKAIKCPQCKKDVCLNCGNVLGVGVKACPKCGQTTGLGAMQSCGCLMLAIGILLFLALSIFLFF